MSTSDEITPLHQRIPTGADDGPPSGDEILDAFIEWTFDRGIELYPAQEEAIMELLADRHVILNTPTGSGKSMVALAMHFYGLCIGKRSVYTSPIKALVSEKFFDLCNQFGAENVGMLTGDASINKGAPIICCTAEILAAVAMTEGDEGNIAFACMDEFHYYGDRDRGIAWQLPLLTLKKTAFLLMSATLGDTRPISKQLEDRTGRPVSLVKTATRPVPLDFTWSEEPLLEQIESLVSHNKAPVYVVNFTQRSTAELAQSLTSLNFCSKEEKKRIAEGIGDFRFDTPYGKSIARYVRHGVGIHHAGLLPKYRMLVEQLAQKGLLKIIVGTDTLGVGINVPIRTVLFSGLTKYDGRKVGVLTVRDFKQIAGRAGRKGFDDHGFVVAQAPPHVVENKKLTAKADGDPKKLRKLKRKKAPEGFVNWDESTFQHLIKSEPEALTSRFNVTHGMLINLLQRPIGPLNPRGGYATLIDLIGRSHERMVRKRHLRRRSKELLSALVEAEVVELIDRPQGPGQTLQVAPDLQNDFSLHHTLSLFLLDALASIDPDEEGYVLKVLTLVEAILENPMAVLYRQEDKAKGQAIAAMKAEGMEYEERMEALEKITWPMPDIDFLVNEFNVFAETRPWLSEDDLKPKSVVRDMYEQYASFNAYVREYGLERSEGVLLRHLNQVYKTLLQNVPDAYRSDDVIDALAYLQTTLQRTDSSLLSAWETMVAGGGSDAEADEAEKKPKDITKDRRAFMALVRAEMHQLVKTLADRDYEEASLLVHQDLDDYWDARRFEKTLDTFYVQYDRIVFDHTARQPKFTQLVPAGERQWKVTQVLVDPEGDNMWFVEARVDMREIEVPEGPLVQVVEIRS
ncbi:MAG: DEAD/DEAH box helicase [Bradymonadia bacterium]